MNMLADRFLPKDSPAEWRRSTMAGSAGIAYFILCITGAPRLRFLTELGAGSTEIALLASCASAMYLFQFLAGVVAPYIRSRKRAWMALALSHRIGFLLFIAAPWILKDNPSALIWCIVIAIVHDAFAHLGNPLWISWMADLLPKARFNALWAARNLYVMAAGIIVTLLAALLFDVFERERMILTGFAVVGTIGIGLGILDVWFFRAIPEPPAPHPATPFRWKSALTPLRTPGLRRFVGFYSVYQFSQFIAMPFLGIFLLKIAGTPSWCLQIILACLALGMFAGYRICGELADRLGEQPVVLLAVCTKLVLPAVFLLSPGTIGILVSALSIAALLDGFADAAMVVCANGYLIKHTPSASRVLMMGTANFVALGIAGGLAPLGGAWLVQITFSIDPARGGCGIVFATALLLRLGSILLLRWVDFAHHPTSLDAGGVTPLSPRGH